MKTISHLRHPRGMRREASSPNSVRTLSEDDLLYTQLKYAKVMLGLSARRIGNPAVPCLFVCLFVSTTLS